MFAEHLENFLPHLFGENRPAVEHGDQDPEHPQLSIRSCLDFVDGLEKIVRSLEGKIRSLDRNQYVGSCYQRVDGQKPESWRSIDDDRVEPPSHSVDGVLETVGCVELADKPNIELCHGNSGWCNPEVVVGARDDDLLEGRDGGEHIVHVAVDGFEFNVGHRRVGLWIEVDEEGAQTFLGETRSKVDCVFPTPPF